MNADGSRQGRAPEGEQHVTEQACCGKAACSRSAGHTLCCHFRLAICFDQGAVQVVPAFAVWQRHQCVVS